MYLAIMSSVWMPLAVLHCDADVDLLQVRLQSQPRNPPCRPRQDLRPLQLAPEQPSRLRSLARSATHFPNRRQDEQMTHIRHQVQVFAQVVFEAGHSQHLPETKQGQWQESRAFMHKLRDCQCNFETCPDAVS